MWSGNPAGKFVPKKKHPLAMKKGWRAGRGGRLAYNINMKVGGSLPSWFIWLSWFLHSHHLEASTPF